MLGDNADQVGTPGRNRMVTDAMFDRGERMPPSVYKIIYRSKISDDHTNEQVIEHVKQVLAWSRSWNPKNGITGALMLDEHGFAQVLEGPSHAVKALFGHIVCDRRHREVELMESDFQPERDFSNWAMAFVRSTSEADIRLATTARDDKVVVGDGAAGVLSMLRWLLREQP